MRCPPPPMPERNRCGCAPQIPLSLPGERDLPAKLVCPGDVQIWGGQHGMYARVTAKKRVLLRCAAAMRSCAAAMRSCAVLLRCRAAMLLRALLLRSPPLVAIAVALLRCASSLCRCRPACNVAAGASCVRVRAAYHTCVHPHSGTCHHKTGTGVQKAGDR